VPVKTTVVDWFVWLRKVQFETLLARLTLRIVSAAPEGAMLPSKMAPLMVIVTCPNSCCKVDSKDVCAYRPPDSCQESEYMAAITPTMHTVPERDLECLTTSQACSAQ
jgi:hypothetical protein